MSGEKNKSKENLLQDIQKQQKHIQELESRISEHAEAENDLRSSEEKYRSLMDNLPGTVARIDTEGKFLFVNKHFLKLSGLTEEDIIGKGPDVIERFYEPESYQRMVADVIRSLTEQVRVETELHLTDIRGVEYFLLQTAYPWYCESGELGGIEILTHDITDRKKAEQKLALHQEQLEFLIDQRTQELKETNRLLQEEISERKQVERALRESEEKFRTLAEKSPNIIFIYKGGTVVYVNDRCKEVLDYTKDEILAPDFNFYSVIAPEYHDLITQNYEQHMQGKEIKPYECDLLAKNGKHINVIITTKLITYQGVSSIFGIATDITELHNLMKYLAELEINQRMEIGHDLHDGLGQYLTGVSLKCKAIEHMLDEGAQVYKSDIAEITELINTATQKAHDLSEGLAPSSLHVGGIETALSELAQQTGNLFNVTCKFHCLHGIKNMNQIATTHFYRIAQEAVTNAVRHGKPGQITITLERKKGNVILKIQDDGIGIGQNELNKGGMGVRIMHYRAQTIDAVLEIKPALKRGTVVCCTLPETKSTAK
jgi:two-component system CheB/CheR fusion protein